MGEPRRTTSHLLTTSMERSALLSHQEHSPRAFVEPSAITTTTFTHTNVSATIVGKLIVIENGNSKGCVRRVKSRSTTTATWDTAIPSTTGVTSIRAFKSPDDPPVASGAGSTTTLVVSAHGSLTGRPDDYVNSRGYFLAFYGGQNAGKAALVTDFVSVGGTYTFTPAVTSTIAEEAAYLLKPLRPHGEPQITASRGTVERRILGHVAADEEIITSYEGASIAFDLEVRPCLTAASGATGPAVPVELDDMLTDFLTATANGASTVASAGSDNVTVALGHGTRFSPGGFMLTEDGGVVQVHNITGDAVFTRDGTVNNGVINASSNVYGAQFYKPRADNSAYFTRTFRLWRGGLALQEFYGCATTLTLEIARGATPKFKFAYQAGEVVEYNVARPVLVSATAPITLVNYGTPFDAKYSRVRFENIAFDVEMLTIELGIIPVMRPKVGGLNESDGYDYDIGPAKFSMKMRSDRDEVASSTDMIDRIAIGEKCPMVFQHGSAPGRTFAFGAPWIQFTKADHSEDNRIGTYDIEGKILMPQLNTADVSYAEASLPPWAFGWL